MAKVVNNTDYSLGDAKKAFPSKVFIISLVVVLGAASLLFLRANRPVVFIIERTQVGTELRSITSAFQSYLSIGQSVVNLSNEQGLEENNRALCAMLIPDVDSSSEKPVLLEHLNTDGGTLNDPWGTPYNVLFPNEGGFALIGGVETEVPSIVVWSSGMNKQNEFGDGDDVANWKDDVR